MLFGLSLSGGDQGLLNMFFRDWSTKDISRHLSFVYNVVSQAFYSYQPAFKQWDDGYLLFLNCIHISMEYNKYKTVFGLH